MYMYMHMCVHRPYTVWCPQRSEEGVDEGRESPFGSKEPNLGLL